MTGTAGQLLEDFIRELNGNVFLREFAVSSGRIDVPAGEVEIADTMVLLRGLVLVYQLKEREPDADCSEAALQRWFERKVSGVAVHIALLVMGQPETAMAGPVSTGRAVENTMPVEKPAPRAWLRQSC